MHGSTQRWHGSVFLLKISCWNFSKAVRCDANLDPDPWVRIRKKIHQNRKCKWFRIRTWSGSANHTKLNANASGSGFLNPDSGIFMRTPDSHRIRTVGTDPLLRIQSGCINSCVWGYLNAKASECLDAWLDHWMPISPKFSNVIYEIEKTTLRSVKSIFDSADI